jgi:hypothetical protein
MVEAAEKSAEETAAAAAAEKGEEGGGGASTPKEDKAAEAEAEGAAPTSVLDAKCSETAQDKKYNGPTGKVLRIQCPKACID